MWAGGSDIFLQFPAETAMRVLHPGTVATSGDDQLTVQFDEADLAIAPGQDVLMYYDVGQRFHKHPAKVVEVMLDGRQPTATVAWSEEPAPADSRQCYRTVTVMTDLTVQVGDEPACPLLDASMTGLAVVSRQVHSVGAVLAVALEYEGQAYQGLARVQSVCDLGAGRMRYGFHSTGGRGPSDNLLKGLQQVTMGMQRLQLQRRSGMR